MFAEILRFRGDPTEILVLKELIKDRLKVL